MTENLQTKSDWLCCPKCGGKARRETDTMDTLIRFKDGKIEDIKLPDA